MNPEFSSIQRIDTLGEGARSVSIAANETERAALAVRFGLIGIDRLEAEAALTRKADDVFAVGRLKADVIQACVASGEPIPVSVDTQFSLRFVPEGVAEGTEIEINAADCDIIDYSGSHIDLGEAVAETMVLELDPFPRSPKADAILREAGVLPEDEAGPFSVLKGLRDALKK